MADRLTARLQERVFERRRDLVADENDASHAGPWTAEEFLAGGHLRVGDIVLCARAGNLLSAFVRWATDSCFSHAGMIYYAPKQDQGFEHHFLIEAGVDLSPLKPYLLDPAATVAILRIPATKAWMTDDLSHEMRGRLMETIADTYDFSTIERLVAETIKTSLFGLESMARGTALTIAAMRERKPSSLPHAFICSGLVQVGYTFACLQAIKTGAVRPEALRDSIFRNDLLQWFEPEWSHYTDAGKIEQCEELFQTFLGDLEATTPADIALSENVEWRFLCRGGRVRRVNSVAEAEALMRAAP